jgi:large subunit ribosomal protein L6
MSRVGKNPVTIPEGVSVSVNAQEVVVKGKNGELATNMPSHVAVSVEDSAVVVKPIDNSKKARALWGTCRSILSNLVQGVSEGFTVNLEVNGVGYRCQVQGNELVMQLGFSHEVRFPIPQGITIKCEKPTLISIHGANKQAVGQVASNIRKYRLPEPYKGKGIKYENEQILRKEGKKK